MAMIDASIVVPGIVVDSCSWLESSIASVAVMIVIHLLGRASIAVMILIVLSYDCYSFALLFLV